MQQNRCPGRDLSDVIGGWGMGACVFSLCGMVGLVVAFLRHNGNRT